MLLVLQANDRNVNNKYVRCAKYMAYRTIPQLFPLLTPVT